MHRMYIRASLHSWSNFFLRTPNQITKVHAHQTHFCDKSLFDVWAFEKIAKVNEGGYMYVVVLCLKVDYCAAVKKYQILYL